MALRAFLMTVGWRILTRQSIVGQFHVIPRGTGRSRCCCAPAGIQGVALQVQPNPGSEK